MSDMRLVSDILSDKLGSEVMKKGYGRGLLAAGRKDDQLVLVSSDVVSSTGSDTFTNEFPGRFIEVGIAEQNLVTVASGLAAMGKNTFTAAYGAFMPGRCWEQIRTTICINDRSVKLVGTHVGLSDAPDGATHQVLEDIALMRVLPNMTVIAPCDSVEAEKATIALAQYKHPAYMRIARDDTVTITTVDTPFKIGDAYVYWVGYDVSIIATGRMTYRAMQAAAKLHKDGIRAEVVHVPTIKPLDADTILASVRKTKCAVTAEEAQMAGGLGGAVAELLAEEFPVPMRRIGVKDRFGESGSPEELFDHCGLTTKHIMFAAHEVLSRKQQT
jgi:transketolase